METWQVRDVPSVQKVPKQRIRRAGLGEMARKQVGLGFLMIARALNVPPAT